MTIHFIDVYSSREAVQVLWELMLERATEDSYNISFTMPDRQSHEAFIARSPFAHWYLIQDDGAWIGYVSASWRNEIGIVLFQTYRGQGYGRAALEKLLKLARPFPAKPGDSPGHFVANINPENAQSIHLFQSLGFELIQHTFALKEEK